MLGLNSPLYQAAAPLPHQAVEADTEINYLAEVGFPTFAAAPQQLAGHLELSPTDGLGAGLLGTGSCGAVFTAFHDNHLVSPSGDKSVPLSTASQCQPVCHACTQWVCTVVATSGLCIHAGGSVSMQCGTAA